MKTKALDYRLLSVLFFINLFPLFVTNKTKYKLMDSLTISSLVLIIGSAFSIMLYVREKSILDVLYVLLIVFFNKAFYKLADYYGGAISLYDCDVVVSNSNFISNKAKKGGAISILNGMGNLTVINSSFTNNFASEMGGALEVEALRGKSILLNVNG